MEWKSEDGLGKRRFDDEYERIFGKQEISNQRGKCTRVYVDGEVVDGQNDAQRNNVRRATKRVEE